MKRFLFIIITIFLLIPIVTLAEEKIEIKSIELIDKSQNTEELSRATIENNTIKVDLKFYNLDDYAIYKVIVKNIGDKTLSFDDDNIISENEYLNYVVEYPDNNLIKKVEEKEVIIKFYYENEVPNNLFRSNLFTTSDNSYIGLSNEKISVIDTLKNLGVIEILLFIIIIMFIVVGLIIMFINRKVSSSQLMIIMFSLLFIPLCVKATDKEEILINANITIQKAMERECSYDGDLVTGAKYIDGQYTYSYKQEMEDSGWTTMDKNGWGVTLTDKESADPVTTKLCTYINGEPVISMSNMFTNSKTTSIDLSSFNTKNVIT